MPLVCSECLFLTVLKQDFCSKKKNKCKCCVLIWRTSHELWPVFRRCCECIGVMLVKSWCVSFKWEQHKIRGKSKAGGLTHAQLIDIFYRERTGKEKNLVLEGQRCQELILSHAAHPERLIWQMMPIPSQNRQASQEVDPEQLQFAVWCLKVHWNLWLFISEFQAAKCRAVGAEWTSQVSLH